MLHLILELYVSFQVADLESKQKTLMSKAVGM